MTQREREILNIIIENPMISQKEMAEILNINRTSVAVHITNLMKKGYIKGKGYIITDEKKITIIGGTNIDLQGFPLSALNLSDSNPGRIETSLGGVGRNIGENLNKLSLPVRLLTAVGDDFYGKKIFRECEELGIDMKYSLVSKNNPTSMYLSVMDEDFDMKVAISQMDIFDELDCNYIKKNQGILKNSKIIVLDTNIPQKTIDYVCNNYADIPIFADTVSKTKSLRIKNSLGKIHTIKPNMYEIENLLGIKVDSLDRAKKAGDVLLNMGIKRAFISMGKIGVYACDDTAQILVKSKVSSIKSTTGAGDAFMAGTIKGFINNLALEDTAVYATATANIAMNSFSTVNPLMSDKAVKDIIDTDIIDIKYL